MSSDQPAAPNRDPAAPTSPQHREWVIEDCRDTHATLRVSATRADVLIDGTVVSTDDAVNAFDILVALGGSAPDWYGPFIAARATFDAAARHAPGIAFADLSRATRSLAKSLPDRQGMARVVHLRSVVSTMRLVALSCDPHVSVRASVARAMPLTGDLCTEVALRLAQDEQQVAQRLCVRPDLRDRADLVEALSRHPSDRVQHELAQPLRPFTARPRA